MNCAYRSRLAGVLALVCLTTAQAAVRVALVTPEQTNDVQAIMDLATVKLSVEPEVQVLERSTIESLLAEQEWSLSGIVGAADAVRAGRLLGADVLMVFQPSASGQPPNVVAFDSSTGIRLADDEVPGENLEAQAERVVELCRQAVHKRRNPDSAARTLSILAIQNVNLPAKQEYLVEAIGYLLERQLVRSPGIAILERERLEALNAERALPGGNLDNGLWSSVHLLEMDIGRGEKEDEIRVYARITDPAGTPQGEFATTGLADAQNLAGSIQNELVRLLEMAPPPGASARAVEAERYRNEAEIQSRTRLSAAIRAIEAAYALNPEDIKILESLAHYHIVYADSLNRMEGVRYLLRQMHWLDLLWFKHGNSSGENELSSFLDWRCPAVDPGRHRGSSFCANQDGYNELLRELQGEYANYLGLNKDGAEARGTDGDPLIRTFEQRWALERIALASPDRDTYLRYLSDYVRGWMDNVRREPDSFRDFRLSEAMRVMRDLTLYSGCDDHAWFFRDSPYYEGLRTLFVEMSAHPVPYMSLYGRLGVLFCDLKTEKISLADALTQVKLIDEEVKARLSSNVKGEENLRNLLYLFLLDLYDQVADLDERQLLYQGLFDFMLNQKTLVPAVGHAATVPYAGYRLDGIIHNVKPLSTNHYPRLIRNAERYLEVIQDRARYHVYPTWEWIRRDQQTTTDALKTMREAIASPTNEHPWIEAVQVMNLKADAPELTRIDQIRLENNNLYILASKLGYVTNPVFGSVPDPAIALFKSDLHGQAPQRIFPPVYDGRCPNSKRLGAICRHQENTYIPTYGDGVLVVSDDGSHHWLNKESGLPSDRVQSVAVLDGSLYIASGEEGHEAYLSRYDLGTAQWTLLAAANRREKVGPLDQLPPYVIRGIYADPKRNRLIFVLDFEQYYLMKRIKGHQPDMPEIGLWSYCPGDGTFKQIVPINRSPLWNQTQGERLFTEPVNYGPYKDGEYNACYGLVVFDYKQDRAGAVYYSEKRPAGPTLAVSEAAQYVPAQIGFPPYAVQRDGIWFGRPTFGRHLFSGEVQFFPDAFPDKAQAEHIDNLILADDGTTLVVATDTQVWIFKRDPSVAMRDEDWEQFISR